jgi:hypothetical protein
MSEKSTRPVGRGGKFKTISADKPSGFTDREISTHHCWDDVVARTLPRIRALLVKSARVASEEGHAEEGSARWTRSVQQFRSA